jgi:uncharacterized 2Fe-2S/4Fe-4S cluster protein (DUF4445 family)
VVELSCDERLASVGPGDSLFEHAVALGVVLPTSCVRQGTCKECVVEVTEGMPCLSPPTPEERHLPQGFRLACRARIAAEAGSVRFRPMRRGATRIERRAFVVPLRGEPAVPEPCVRRDGPRVLLDGHVIARAGGPLHGLALDVGTTTVAVRLFDLESGELVADASLENPQRFGGPDAIARIRYDTHHPGKLLQRTLVGYLVHALAGFRVDPRTIYEVVVAGNPMMRDLFFRLDDRVIAQGAYRSPTELGRDAGRRQGTALAATARGLRFPVHPRARVYGLPIIGGHVGADAAACMLAVELAHEERLVALMDIGADTELVVGNRRRILAASCPAGPAFEGECSGTGMPALPGAIDGVQIRADGSVRTTVIGGGPALGTCASGLVDALSELRRTGRMSELGRFEDGGAEVILAEEGGRRIALQERDVGKAARTKGASVAGLRVLLDRYGARLRDVEVFYLTGGFGDHLDLGSARRIGLIPDLDDARLRRVDDAALEGASLALLSRTRRDELEALVERVEWCRPETDPAFADHFAEGCLLRPMRDEDP